MKESIYLLLIRFINLLIPITPKKILFLSYYGNQYGCSPKYLSEYITQHHKDWKVVWAFTQPNKYNIPNISKVRYLSFRYFYELCTSKVIVTNYRMTDLFRKRKSQVYIQTWHSSLRLKMIEKDAEATLPSHYVEMAKKDSENINWLLSGCEYSTSIFKRCFWYNGQILPTGTPRNDLLFNDDHSLKQQIFKKLEISENTNIVLYAPTFRKGDSLEYYNIQYKQLIQSLEKYKEGGWIVLVRLHPHLRNLSQSLLKGEANVLDATDYDDIQELLYIADMVISDYSSLIFDFAMTLRPCLLYVPDLVEYTSKDRALYFNIKELPFPISLNNKELFEQIENLNLEEYKKNVNTFLASIGSYETGNACEKICNHLNNL